MSKPTPLTALLAGLTLEDIDIARAYHAAPPEVQAFIRFLVTAQTLTAGQAELVARYAQLLPERQALVDTLLRELGPPVAPGQTDESA